MIQISRVFRILESSAPLRTTALLLGAAAMSMPGVMFADSIFPLQADHEIATASLGQVLSERGWSVTREDDGSILLHPQQGNVKVVSMAESDIRHKPAAPMIDADYWQANLEPHGWSVERDFDGNVLLFPGAVEVQTMATTPSTPPQLDIPKQMGLTALRDRLIPHGWGVERDPDGSVLLIPAVMEVQSVATVAPSISPQLEIPGKMDLAWLHDRLSPHGWGVERDSDGSVLLTPGAVAVQTVAVAPSASSPSDAGST